MVRVAQSVRAPGCGPGCAGSNPVSHPFDKPNPVPWARRSWFYFGSIRSRIIVRPRPLYRARRCAQSFAAYLRPWAPGWGPAVGGSNPLAPINEGCKCRFVSVARAPAVVLKALWWHPPRRGRQSSIPTGRILTRGAMRLCAWLLAGQDAPGRNPNSAAHGAVGRQSALRTTVEPRRPHEPRAETRKAGICGPFVDRGERI